MYLPAELNSYDPDYPDTQEGLTYQWFCRVVTEGKEENYTYWDRDGFPLWKDVPFAQQVREGFSARWHNLFSIEEALLL